MANNSVSNELPVTCGVSQGSVFGPLFFLVYVNDLHCVLSNHNFKLYADDTVLYQAGVNAEIAGTNLQIALNKFCEWCKVNKLSINIKKTKLMVFESRSKVKKSKNVKIMVNNKKIQKAPTFKYLGITLAPTLTFNNHISVLTVLLYLVL